MKKYYEQVTKERQKREKGRGERQRQTDRQRDRQTQREGLQYFWSLGSRILISASAVPEGKAYVDGWCFIRPDSMHIPRADFYSSPPRKNVFTLP